jgi:hypothetical protein
MAFYLADYEAKYGRLIIEDFTRPKFSKYLVFGFLYIFIAFFIGLTFLFVDFSRHHTLGLMPQWELKLIGLAGLTYGCFIIYSIRKDFIRHGSCLFEKGILDDGAWGFDDDDNFFPFDRMERIVVAPSRETARRLHVGILTAGFGQPLSDGYADWAYSPAEIENLVRQSLGRILIVHKRRFFDYDHSSIDLSDIVAPSVLIQKLHELAVKNRVAYSQDDFVAQKGDVVPIRYKNIQDCEKEYGKILYPGFTKMPSHLFEGGIIRWASWPLEPDDFNFVDFRNIEAVLVQPSKSTAIKYIEKVDKAYYDHALPDEKEACKIDPLEQEGRALKWENYIVMIFKLKRADTYCEEIKDIKDPRKYILLLKELAKRHGIPVIDESHLPSGTGEKIRLK